MGEQINNLYNLNRPHLVDMNVLDNITNSFRGGSTQSTGFKNKFLTKITNFIQSAGNNTCGLVKDNLFISVIIILLVLFLTWCYIEKKRYDAIQEKILKKKYMKMLLEENDNNEFEYFNEIPDKVQLNELFEEINSELNKPLNNKETNKETNKENSKEIKKESKKESNKESNEESTIEISDITNKPIVKPKTQIESSNSSNMKNNMQNSGSYMDISNFTPTSFMLL